MNVYKRLHFDKHCGADLRLQAYLNLANTSPLLRLLIGIYTLPRSHHPHLIAMLPLKRPKTYYFEEGSICRHPLSLGLNMNSWYTPHPPKCVPFVQRSRLYILPRQHVFRERTSETRIANFWLTPKHRIDQMLVWIRRARILRMKMNEFVIQRRCAWLLKGQSLSVTFVSWTMMLRIKWGP